MSKNPNIVSALPDADCAAYAEMEAEVNKANNVDEVKDVKVADTEISSNATSCNEKQKNKDYGLLNPVFYSRERAHTDIPEVVENALYVGTVALISGPSKVGKTWLVSELAVAVASGGKWLKWQCAQGNVLVFDGEMIGEKLLLRYEEICEKFNLNADDVMKHIDINEMRGRAQEITNFATDIIERAKKLKCSLIIIDPAYPFMTGDENNSGDVRTYTNCMIAIAKETNAAVVYVQHHPKGAMGDRRSIDRASGSGMFGRSPDLIVDTIEISPKKGIDVDKIPKEPAFRIEITSRYFEPEETFNVWFKKPLHEIDNEGILDGWVPMTSEQKGGYKRGNQKREEKEENITVFTQLLDDMFKNAATNQLNRKDIIRVAKDKGICASETTVGSYIKELIGKKYIAKLDTVGKESVYCMLSK